MGDARDQDEIAADYRQAREAGDSNAMRRFQNEESCYVLLAILEQLAAKSSTFVHRIALKGGILLAGELRPPRTSADIDATTGHNDPLDTELVIRDLRDAGRRFNVRPEGSVDRTLGGHVFRFRFDSLTDAAQPNSK